MIVFLLVAICLSEFCIFFVFFFCHIFTARTAELADEFLREALNMSNLHMPYLIVGSTYLLLFLSFLTLCCFRARSLRMIASAGKGDDESGRETADAGVSFIVLDIITRFMVTLIPSPSFDKKNCSKNIRCSAWRTAGRTNEQTPAFFNCSLRWCCWIAILIPSARRFVTVEQWLVFLSISQMALLDGDPYPSSTPSFARQRRRRKGRDKEKAFKVRVLVLLFVFYALYVGMEVTYGGFILTYAVKGPPKMNKVRFW